MKLLGIVINVTPSMKRGIYIRRYSEIKHGDVVAACLSEPYKTLGLKNLYLEKGVRCNGADPVIKKVIAVPGDDVVLDKNFIRVNGILFHFKTLNKDSNGRFLTSYPQGKYKKTKGYWLIGTNSVKSWDSRYWGVVTQNQILYGLKLLYTFD